MRVIFDTREKHPWAFPPGVEMRPGTLKQGDYALEGDNTFSVERKSAQDFRNTVTGAWDRFVRELRRMDDVGNPQKIIIVEGDLSAYLFKETDAGLQDPECDCDPVLLMARIAELTLVYRTAVLFARDEGSAAALAYHIFCKRLCQLSGKAGGVK